MDWHAGVALFLILAVLAGGWGGSHAGAPDDARRAAARAAANKVRYGAAKEVMDRQARGELTDDEAYGLLTELVGPRGGSPGPASRPPRA
jgi:hypothetical protein